MGYSLTKTRIQAGHWEGIVTTAAAGVAAPKIEVTHLQSALPGVSVTDAAAKNQWHLRIPIPAEVLADGVQVFVISEVESGQTLGSFTLLAGEPLQDDIRAEVELLRAELDLLKRAFRRHCTDTA